MTTRTIFFQYLSSVIGYNRNIVFMSDSNHVILKAIRSVFPRSPHAYCHNHFKANLKHRYSGLGKKTRGVLLRFFQKCSYGTTSQQYEKNVQKMLNVGGYRIAGFLKHTPKEMWANDFFPGCRYGPIP